jgi:hypothetical protein
MSSVGEDTPVEPPENESLINLLTTVEEARSGFYEAAGRYVRTPIDSNSKLVVEGATQVVTSLYEFTASVLNDPLSSPDQKGKIVANLLVRDSTDRMTRLNGLFTRKKEKPFMQDPLDQEGLAENIRQALENNPDSSKDLLEGLFDSYGHNLSIDINKLIEHGKTSSLNAKAIALSKVIGRHSLDVLKTGTGIALGVVLIREIERRRYVKD